MPLRFCAHPNCPTRVVRGRCERHRRREADRPNVDARRWYRLPEWRTLRARVLLEEPRCPGRGDGLACGLDTVDVDHRVPHRGDANLFFDRANLQAFCHRCHAAKTGRGL